MNLRSDVRWIGKLKSADMGLWLKEAEAAIVSERSGPSRQMRNMRWIAIRSLRCKKSTVERFRQMKNKLGVVKGPVILYQSAPKGRRVGAQASVDGGGEDSKLERSSACRL